MHRDQLQQRFQERLQRFAADQPEAAALLETLPRGNDVPGGGIRLEIEHFIRLGTLSHPVIAEAVRDGCERYARNARRYERPSTDQSRERA